MGSGREHVQEKADAAIPMNTLSTPEGNTTPTWCVALPWVSEDDLEDALDWACGPGKVDCSPIQPRGVCYEPDTIVSHASFAFNTYYQQNANSDAACYFEGTATLTTKNPSYGKCVYSTLGSKSSSASAFSKYKPSSIGENTNEYSLDMRFKLNTSKENRVMSIEL
ncbi:X8 domain [Dillenia turbinata]|uniref:X8 domain n=1 Tax=Dillenia turbinata TaxID=194707 RepID=A0AAN8VMB2_9MAGN